ncbi:hypothetical protein DSO57_1010769 [Entomophthora muscae]|uniref:Uncharacterized protein n=2 Tax=Entomophthora muscae TaxID=34485 RepID=A0ACC2SEW5_9FUNG|nr:hypothetical protein DSO57_1028085 [Entomophthora muscae]KAJ9085759.1 hypothetical protein DSO57_1010769 [Entomophthora muscae]
MEIEITNAFDLILRMINAPTLLTEPQISAWKSAFVGELTKRFSDHWLPESPFQGNAYRSLTVLNGEVDPVLLETCQLAGIPASILKNSLPKELVIWVDPYVVSYRTGDQSPVISFWEDRSRGKLALIMQQRAANTVKVTLRTPSP